MRQTEERDQSEAGWGQWEWRRRDKEEYWGSRINRCCAEDVRAGHTPLLSVTDTSIVMPFTETVRRKKQICKWRQAIQLWKWVWGTAKSCR